MGGYIGAKALEEPDALKAMGIGVLMGLVIGLASAAVIGIVIAIFGLDTFWLALAPAAGVWTAGLGMIGALLGSRSAGSEARF